MSESAIQKEIYLAATRLGARLFRNNIGSLKNERGDWITFGVCNPGGSDTMGWTHDGRFLAVETKVLGRRTEKKRLESQKNFIAQVNAAGGVGMMVTSCGEFVDKYRAACSRP